MKYAIPLHNKKIDMLAEEKAELLLRIETALDSVRPHLMADGGDVEIVELTDQMELRIKWMGMCESCSMSAFTLKAGIEDAVKRAVPQITHVVATNSAHLLPVESFK